MMEVAVTLLAGVVVGMIVSNHLLDQSMANNKSAIDLIRKLVEDLEDRKK